jgi:hypothetical protein
LQERKEAIERGKQRERENEQVKDEKTVRTYLIIFFSSVVAQ